MILVFGGIKGGVGKTTLATHLAILRSHQGKDVLLVDADDQGTASDFTTVRNETLADQGGAGYTSIKLHGAAVRSELLRMATKYDDIVIDVGGRDTAGQRAALSVADVYVVPFLPGSFDVWTLESVGQLVEEAQAFNEKLKAVCVINRADAKGSDNAEAAAIAGEIPSLTYLDAPLGNRKAFRSAAAQGLAVTEVKPTDAKAIAEVTRLFEYLFDI
jgi:chromosome partitioning protein